MKTEAITEDTLLDEGDILIGKERRDTLEILGYDVLNNVYILSLEGETHPIIDGNTPFATKQALMENYERVIE